jgi:hypothetical protein
MPSWFSVLMRWIRGNVLDTDAPKLAGMQQIAAQLGVPVLEATSVANLEDRLDEAFLRPEYQRYLREATRGLTLEMLRVLSTLSVPSEPSEDMIHALGIAPARIVTATSPHVATIAAIVMPIFAEHGEDLRAMEPPDCQELFARPGVHSTIRRIFLDYFRCTVALLAMSHAIFAGRKLEPWLAFALAEKYRDGLYAYLRYWASLDMHVPESIVPLTDRLDLQALQAEIDANEMLWDQIAQLAPEDGFTVCGVPDEDD